MQDYENSDFLECLSAAALVWRTMGDFIFMKQLSHITRSVSQKEWSKPIDIEGEKRETFQIGLLAFSEATLLNIQPTTFQNNILRECFPGNFLKLS